MTSFSVYVLVCVTSFERQILAFRALDGPHTILTCSSEQCPNEESERGKGMSARRLRRGMSFFRNDI